MAAQAGWWEYQQDAPGWEQGHSSSRDTCRAVEIIAGNKPVSFLTLIKQLRGDTRRPTQTRRRRRPWPGRRGDGISVGAVGVARGALPRPCPGRAALPHPSPCCSLPAGPLGISGEWAGWRCRDGGDGMSQPCDECGRSQPQPRGGGSAVAVTERGDGRASARHRGCGMERDASNRSAWKRSRSYIC